MAFLKTGLSKALLCLAAMILCVIFYFIYNWWMTRSLNRIRKRVQQEQDLVHLGPAGSAFHNHDMSMGSQGPSEESHLLACKHGGGNAVNSTGSGFDNPIRKEAEKPPFAPVATQPEKEER